MSPSLRESLYWWYVATMTKVRVLSNVCRHRWTQVATGTGQCQAFCVPLSCLDLRSLQGRSEYILGIWKKAVHSILSAGYPKYAPKIWQGFLYVNLDGQASTTGAAASVPLQTLIRDYHLEEMTRFTGGDEVWRARTGSMLTENFTEGLPQPTNPHGLAGACGACGAHQIPRWRRCLQFDDCPGDIPDRPRHANPTTRIWRATQRQARLCWRACVPLAGFCAGTRSGSFICV